MFVDSRRKSFAMPWKCAGFLALAAAAPSVLLPGATPAALAQPAPESTSPLLDGTKLPPVTAAERATLDRALGLVKQEQIARSTVPLKVENANAEEVAAQLQKQLKDETKITVRGAGDARFTMDVAEVSVGQLLQSVGNLAGCKLYLLNDGLLLTSEKQLSESERDDSNVVDWAKTLDGSGGYGIPIQRIVQGALVDAVVSKFKASANLPQPVVPDNNAPLALNTKPGAEFRYSLASLNPDLRRTVQQWADLVRENSPNRDNLPLLQPDSVISYKPSQTGGYVLSIAVKVSGGKYAGGYAAMR